MVNTPNLKLGNTNIHRVDEFNFLGLSFNEQLNWQSQFDKISKGAPEL